MKKSAYFTWKDYQYATIKPWGLYSYMPSFIMLSLMVAYIYLNL